ncbi:MAG TPA: protein kinase [Terriglobales bacterium]|nr:protein kinase [Terriglobales bacterium]
MDYIDRGAEPSYDSAVPLANMAAPDLTPGQTLGHFRLIEQIGAGGMGIVYRAWDLRLQRDVAVKVLNPKTLADHSGSQRFRREALILGRLNHTNVEAVYDFHSENGLDYLVIEYVPGTSLDDRVHQGALPEKEVISLGIQLARGLAAAHAQGIIHRDLKPGNLRVTPDHVLKILDFGLAQLFAAPGAGTLTETATVTMAAAGFAGTLAYMAPEQLEGQEPDTRSDVYSAGVVLYEMATGTRPFPQRGQMLWEAILHSLPTAPRIKKADISPELEAVILKCLERDPNLRYQAANELLEDLSRLSAGRETTATSQLARMAELAAAKARKRRIAIVLGVVLLLGIALGVAMRKWPGPKVQQKIMAVLPFDSVGQDASINALGLGLTETLTAKLTQASNSDAVQVVSPRDLRDQGVKTAEDARRAFGTDFVLESSLQQSGHIIRINCYLVDSKTHRQIAAKTIEAEVGDPFGLQDRVVSAALDMLPTQIKPEQRRKLEVRQDTEPAAYEAYIRGRGYLQEYENPENIESAINEFNKAIHIDSHYAPAYAGLGEANWTASEQFLKGDDWISNAARNCEKALSLNAELVEGHVCLGNVLNGTGKYAEAADEFKRALVSNPESEEALRGLAEAYTKLGDAAAAELTYKKAIALRPNYWGVYSWLGLFYYNQARYSDAVDMFLKTTQLAPDNYRGYTVLGGAYVDEGRYQEAIDAFKRSIDLRPSFEGYNNLSYAYYLMHRFPESVATQQQALKLNDSYWMNWGNLGDALYWSPNRRAEAPEKYHKAISIAQSKLKVNPRDPLTLAYLANYSAMINDPNAAFGYLQRALEVAPSDPEVLFRAAIVHNHFGETQNTLDFLKKALAAGYSRAIIRDSPDFEALRSTPQFRSLAGNNNP